MKTNTEHRRRETDRVDQVCMKYQLEKAESRIAELEQLLAECEDEFLSIIAFGTTDKIRVLVVKIDSLLPPAAAKEGE